MFWINFVTVFFLVQSVPFEQFSDNEIDATDMTATEMEQDGKIYICLGNQTHKLTDLTF